MAEPLARQPLGVGAGLAALALVGAVAAPSLAGVVALAVAVPMAMVAYSALAAGRATAPARRQSIALEAGNAGLRRDVLGSLAALVAGRRGAEAAVERHYLGLVRAYLSADEPSGEHGGLDSRALVPGGSGSAHA